MVGSLGVVLAVLCMPAQGSAAAAPSTAGPTSTLDQMLTIPSGQPADTSSVVTWTPTNAETVVTVTSPDGSSKTVTYYINGEPPLPTSTGPIMASPKDGQLEKMYIVAMGEGSNPTTIDPMAIGVGTDPSKIDPMAFGVLPKAGDMPITSPSYTIVLPPGTKAPSAPLTPKSTPGK